MAKTDVKTIRAIANYMMDNNLIGYTYHTTKKSVIFVDCIGDRKVIPLQEVVN